MWFPLSSHQMDVYSFGVLLLEMQTGELPSVDQRGQQLATVTGQRQLYRLIRVCMANEPERRPNMTYIIRELEDLSHSVQCKCIIRCLKIHTFLIDFPKGAFQRQ